MAMRILTIFLLSFSMMFSKINVEKITDNSAVLKFKNYKMGNSISVILTLKNAKIELPKKMNPSDVKNVNLNDCQRIDKNAYLIYNSKVKKEISIKGLKASTEYFIKVFTNKNGKLIDSTKFFTLSKEPTEQSKYIVFKNAKPKEITLLFKKGDGERRVVFVSKNKKIALPKDGKSYKANPIYGSFESAVAKTTYCVYSGDKNEITVKGLKPEVKYYFRIFEFNGNNATTNYLTKKESQNPRSKVMPLPPPVALKATNITNDGFTAHWKKVEGAVYYEIDVSQDKKFRNYLQFYEHMDIGNIDEIEIVELKPGKYYYRLKAVGKYSRSPYSNIIEVKIKEKKENSLEKRK